jgi:SAM-dependent methyltransferase
MTKATPPRGWNHNNHFHDSLIASIPPGCGSALDVGCGSGEFAARLSSFCHSVEAIDTDRDAIEFARRTYADRPNIEFACLPFEDTAIKGDRYDFVSLIASLHHMDARASLAKIREILRPGGVAAILGLYEEKAGVDWLYSLISVPLNLLLRSARGKRGSAGIPDMVIRDPDLTIKEIRALLNEELPHHSFKRRLFWRYSAIWRKPASPDPPV